MANEILDLDQKLALVVEEAQTAMLEIWQEILQNAFDEASLEVKNPVKPVTWPGVIVTSGDRTLARVECLMLRCGE